MCLMFLQATESVSDQVERKFNGKVSQFEHKDNMETLVNWNERYNTINDNNYCILFKYYAKILTFNLYSKIIQVVSDVCVICDVDIRKNDITHVNRDYVNQLLLLFKCAIHDSCSYFVVCVCVCVCSFAIAVVVKLGNSVTCMERVVIVC